MARERINPEFSPDRVVQPTAAPVDRYFRPVLTQPDVSQQLEVAKALQGLVPQLQRFASDATASAIKVEQTLGAKEAMELKTPEEMLKKQAEYIEKAGGLAPWRYTAALKVVGDRLVNEVYVPALYGQLEDLSNPTNADGTLRDPGYVTTRMREIYANANIPENSYYITAAATKARAEADQMFLNRVTMLRTEKVKQKNSNDLKDTIFRSLKITPTEKIEDLFADGGQITQAVNSYYQSGFGSGDEELVSSMTDWMEALTAANDFDGARRVGRFLMTSKVGSRKIGDRYTPLLMKKIDEIDDAEMKEEAQRISLRDARTQSVQREAMGGWLQYVQEQTVARQKDGLPGSFSLSMDKVMQVAETVVGSLPGDEASKRAALPRVAEDIRAYLERIDSNDKSDPTVYSSMMREAVTGASTGYENRLLASLSDGSLNKNDFQTLMGMHQRTQSLSQTENQSITEAASAVGLDGIGFTGLGPEAISPDARQTLVQIGEQARIEAMQEIRGKITDPAFVQKYAADPTGRQFAVAQVAREVFARKRKEVTADNKELIDSANLTASFDNTYTSSGVAQNVNEWAANAVESMGVDKEQAYDMTEAVALELRTELEKFWSGVPGPLSAKKDALIKAMPGIKSKLKAKMRVNPQGLSMMPPELRNVLSVPSSTGSPVTDPAIASGTGVIGSAVRQESGFFDIMARGAPSGSPEAKTRDVANTIAKVAVEVEANPTKENKAKFDEAKANLNKNAEEGIAFLTDEPLTNDVRFRYMTGINGITADSRRYEIRGDGVYSFANVPGEYNPSEGRRYEMKRVFDPAVTARYWVYKTINGYSPEEVVAGRTAEGLAIDKDKLNPSEFLFFRTVSQFDAAVNEYAASGGSKGYIAEVVLPAVAPYGTTFDALKNAQLQLLKRRKPLN